MTIVLKMFSRPWWIKARNRAARSAAQMFILAAGSDAMGWVNLRWDQVGLAIVGAIVLSVAHFILITPEEARRKA